MKRAEMETNIGSLYFKWIMKSIKYDCNKLQLYYYLDTIPFTYIIPMDENRLIDGKSMRDKFIQYNNHNKNKYIDLKTVFANSNVSVLEVIFGLAFRMETDIYRLGEYGSSVDSSKWFNIMMNNLGFSHINNNNFYENLNYINNRISIFMDRKYGNNGEGSLFPIIVNEELNNSHLNFKDFNMSKIDMYYQANLYITMFFN